MIHDILEQKLIAIGFTAGVDLFRSFMPGDVSRGVMTRSALRGILVDPYKPNHYIGEMQIVVRHQDPVDGLKMANLVQRALQVETRTIYPATSERGETHLDMFIPETLPIQFPRLDGSAIEWSQNFHMVFGMKPLAA